MFNFKSITILFFVVIAACSKPDQLKQEVAPQKVVAANCDREPNKWSIFKVKEFNEVFIDSIFDVIDPAYHPVVRGLDSLRHGSPVEDVIKVLGRVPDETKAKKHNSQFVRYRWLVDYETTGVIYTVRYWRGCMKDISLLQTNDTDTLYSRGYIYK